VLLPVFGTNRRKKSRNTTMKQNLMEHWFFQGKRVGWRRQQGVADPGCWGRRCHHRLQHDRQCWRYLQNTGDDAPDCQHQLYVGCTLWYFTGAIGIWNWCQSVTPSVWTNNKENSCIIIVLHKLLLTDYEKYTL
jgi:hypothetical protein